MKEAFYIYNSKESNTKFFISSNYNYSFNKDNGQFKRWGKTFDDDPTYSPFGPEILDFEITSICDKGCSYCYKSNTSVGCNVPFDAFKTIINKVNENKQLTQVAFGLGATGEENRDLWKMCKWLREQGVIPNGTIADITDETADRIAKYFGACAVSIHGDKNICYNMVKKLTDRGMKQVNIHHVIYDENYDETLQIFDDIKEDSRLAKLNAIVFLSLKKKGRAEKGNFTPLSQDKFSNLVNHALARGINFGFDSCSANKFAKAIENHFDRKRMMELCEPCESFGVFSSYGNVEGKYFPCSFSEGEGEFKDGFDLSKVTNFIDEVWNGDLLSNFRKKSLKCGRKCLLFEI